LKPEPAIEQHVQQPPQQRWDVDMPDAPAH
jgi:hypothetical protein